MAIRLTARALADSELTISDHEHVDG
jgi:hypothetical protein